MIIKYQLSIFRYFCLEFFFLFVDQWKVFTKIKLVFRPTFWYMVPYFCTTKYFSLDTSYLNHCTILLDGRL